MKKSTLLFSLMALTIFGSLYTELIWKIYQRATGLEIGKLEKLSSFDLSAEAVKKKMKERYGNKIPLNETVISPAAVFESELLIMVKSN